MSYDKSKFNRRDFIKAAGASAGLALPLLKSQVAMGLVETAPVRVLLVPLQHGWGMSRFAKDISGSEFNFTLPTYAQAAFNPIKDQTVFIDGLRSDVWGNGHDKNYSSMFTCSTRYIGQTATVPNNPILGGPFPMPRTSSLDWMIGNQAGKGVLRLSNNYASWGAAYHPLSFDNTLRNLPFYTNARSAYMDIIDPLKTMTPANPVQSAASVSNSALFSVLGKSTDRLLAMLTGTERAKMEAYLVSMNSLGGKILTPTSMTSNPANIVLPPLPGMTQAFNDQLDSYLEMIRVAFTLDTHRVAVLGLGEGVTNWNWSDAGGVARVGNTFGSDFHHEVAHYTEANSRNSFEGWTQWYARKISDFALRLKSIVDVDGRPLLDNTIIVLCGEVGDGQHDTSNMVIPVIGGGGAGRIRRNRWIRVPTANSWQEWDASGSVQSFNDVWGRKVSSRHLADLWVTIGNLAGLNVTSFGDRINNNAPISLT